MKALQDKATFYVPKGVTTAGDEDGAVPVQGAVAAAVISAMARDSFLPNATQDGFVDGKPVSLVTVYSDRQGRTDFNYFVTNAAGQVGRTMELAEVWVEVNGVLGIYKRGEDYL